MIKNFFRHWHYGIKAKVVDGALVAHIDTAVDPVFVRFDLARLQSVMIDISTKNGDYELVLAGVGAPAASTTLARFEVRAAAEEAAACLRRALLRGNHKSRFRSAFKVTFGILAALLLATLLAAVLEKAYQGGAAGTPQSASPAAILGNLGAEIGGDESVKPADPSQPQSADEFLNNNNQ